MSIAGLRLHLPNRRVAARAWVALAIFCGVSLIHTWVQGLEAEPGDGTDPLAADASASRAMTAGDFRAMYEGSTVAGIVAEGTLSFP